jgi:hypothetical protein
VPVDVEAPALLSTRYASDEGDAMPSPALPRDRTSVRRTPPADFTTTPAPRAGEQAPPGVAARYRYDRRTSSWWWSPEMFAVQGLRPDAATPGTEALLRHQPPEDRSRTLAAITAACEEARAFSLETRFTRADGAHRSFVLVGEPTLDPDGRVVAVDGLCVDITDGRPPGSESERVLALETEVEQLRAAMASRAAIEQAKGILMLLTSCGDQAAFDLLAHISSHTHRKVRDVANAITASAAGRTKLADDVRGIIRDACPPPHLR